MKHTIVFLFALGLMVTLSPLAALAHAGFRCPKTMDQSGQLRILEAVGSGVMSRPCHQKSSPIECAHAPGTVGPVTLRLSTPGLVLGPRRLGTLQSEVMDILWQSDLSMTPAEVAAELGRRRGYTTVMTVLSRLFDQGLLERERSERAYAYRPIASREAFVADRLSELLRNSTDSAAAFAGFVAHLDDRERTELLGELRRKDIQL